MTSGEGAPSMATDSLPPPPVETGVEALRDAMALLWPSPASVEVVRRGSAVAPGRHVIREHLLLPNAQKPRLVVPAGEHRAAAAIARGRGDLSNGRRLLPAVSGALARAGLADALGRDRIRITTPDPDQRTDIEHELAQILQQPVVVGVSLGSPRVNRKPILHVLDRDGQTLAFAKVGHTASTQELVATEAATLRRLGERSLSLIDVPRVLYAGDWRDLQLLVLSAVGGGQRNVDVDRPPFAAMRELAGIDGVHQSLLGGSPFIDRLRRSMAAIADEQATSRFVQALDRVEENAAKTQVAFGAWHGDWTPWNMTKVNTSGRVALWDWERFDTGVPVGFDAAHYSLQALLQQHGTSSTTEHRFLAAADTFVVDGGAIAGTGTIVTALYVAELATRYLTLLEGPDGAPLARRSAWILPLLETCAARV